MVEEAKDGIILVVVGKVLGSLENNFNVRKLIVIEITMARGKFFHWGKTTIALVVIIAANGRTSL